MSLAMVRSLDRSAREIPVRLPPTYCPRTDGAIQFFEVEWKDPACLVIGLLERPGAGCR